ncbi:hypothetical protein D9602_20845 [Sphingomonas sp. TX0522]|nr:hypothetical protein [Sphingomonas sp. TX0522]
MLPKVLDFYQPNLRVFCYDKIDGFCATTGLIILATIMLPVIIFLSKVYVFKRKRQVSLN